MSLYDQLRQANPNLTHRQINDIIDRAATEQAASFPGGQAVIDTVAALIRKRQREYESMTFRDQVDAWAELLDRHAGVSLHPRTLDGRADPARQEEQALAAAGLGELDLTRRGSFANADTPPRREDDVNRMTPAEYRRWRDNVVDEYHPDRGG